MPEIIIHHYPVSPVAEKVRAAMGLKRLAWRSVEHNRLPDRPELFAMTGGYRRIPVMQVGADIYCDTQCILRELERRHPSPSLLAGSGGGLSYGLSRWTDGPVFDLMFRVAFAPVKESLPPALVKDRARLYLGPAADLDAELADLPHTLAQLRAQLGWLDDALAARPWLQGDQPGYNDLVAWFLYWFIDARYQQATEYLSELPHLVAWAARMKAIGHGSPTPMTGAEALAVAKAAEPATAEKADARDPQGLKPGMKVTVGPVTDSGDPLVEGVVRAVDRNTIALTREHPLCGRVVTHFPRVGYRVRVV